MKLISIVAACALVSASVEAKTFLFPIPQEVQWFGTSAHISTDKFRLENIQNNHVQKAAERYIDLIKKEKWTPVQVSTDNATVSAPAHELEGIKFQVTDNTAKLDYGIDESYNLHVPDNGLININSKTWIGAIRALQTLSQMAVAGDGDKLVAHTANITDAPTYAHRGISLDTSRNFYPVDKILHTIETQAMNKMNVFHWHVTDSQSWPLYFHSHPELSDKGAYSAAETYNPEDVEKILAFAEERGVRVILELDMPAHTAIIGESHPEHIICGDKFWAEFALVDHILEELLSLLLTYDCFSFLVLNLLLANLIP